MAAALDRLFTGRHSALVSCVLRPGGGQKLVKQTGAEGTYKGKAPEVKSRKGTKFGCRVMGEGRVQQHGIGGKAEPAVTGSWMPR